MKGMIVRTTFRSDFDFKDDQAMPVTDDEKQAWLMAFQVETMKSLAALTWDQLRIEPFDKANAEVASRGGAVGGNAKGRP